ncbi:MAG TPA: quinone-dependent dihydroorotate dehydrogenase [Casimicrobiaceae bacterium]|nr:quinone-dependent dihydroorotate dehydrogenase [Casimicrobiaceae bacterium]
MLYPLLRPLLFSLEPEQAHSLSLSALDAASRLHLAKLSLPRVAADPVEAMGITFPNRIGLAAGLDKNAEHIDGLAAIGFGHIECGTVTPRAQPGNPKPRLFRLPSADALINRMGFNNAGLDTFLHNVSQSRYQGVLGLNIGKNFDTPNERAADDYLSCLRGCYARASYVTVNVSSPNTKGLRDLQHEGALAKLVGKLKREQQKLTQKHGKHTPLTLKIAPDLDDDAIERIAKLVITKGIDGVIATNTTIARASVERMRHGDETGGLSGRPLKDRATEVVRRLARALDGAVPVIGVGGILSGADAKEKLDAGATLVQIYTGLIYRGPALVAECVDAMRKR